MLSQRTTSSSIEFCYELIVFFLSLLWTCEVWCVCCCNSSCRLTSTFRHYSCAIWNFFERENFSFLIKKFKFSTLKLEIPINFNNFIFHLLTFCQSMLVHLSNDFITNLINLNSSLATEVSRSADLWWFTVRTSNP